MASLKQLLLKYNAFDGNVPRELDQLHQLELVQLQGNRIQGNLNMSVTNMKYKNSSFVSDCGSPSAFESPVECNNCTMCCEFDEGGVKMLVCYAPKLTSCGLSPLLSSYQATLMKTVFL